ncbi:MAG: pantoate--beta-alanine ligase [Saprospiraceae bacterium]
MILFKKEYQLQNYLTNLKSDKKSIGFVPTMGALHDGHLSLIQKAKEENDCVVCSIFVNPTQFNNATDLEKYPRTAAKDIELLTSIGTEVLLMPPVEEVYPKGLDTTLELDFGDLANVMEGEFRPGHFDGMAQVVNRLLNMVQPHSLYMGQKDFQQITIVRNMLTQLKSDIKLVMCPIKREETGLAMSSRNVRLTPENRNLAVKISQTLLEAKKLVDSKTPEEVKKWAMQELSIPEFKPEYFSIVDGITLQSIEDFGKTNFAVACTAVWAGEVRLIDNMVLKL